MKALGLLIALFFVCLGVVALIAPYALLSLAPHIVTPTGLYIAAALRIVIGLVLLGAALASRMPKTLRVFGIVALIAGVGTLFLGVDRARAIASWGSNQGGSAIRVFGLLALVVGGVIAYALVANRRAA
jgi:uncharacterized protein YjeT (DUF2065 family)